MDKGIPLRKELAMPNLHKSAAREASGNAPKSFPGSEKEVVKGADRTKSPGCGVVNPK